MSFLRAPFCHIFFVPLLCVIMVAYGTMNGRTLFTIRRVPQNIGLGQALAHLEVKQWWCEVHLFRFMPLTVSDIDVCMSQVTFSNKEEASGARNTWENYQLYARQVMFFIRLSEQRCRLYPCILIYSNVVTTVDLQDKGVAGMHHPYL